ncbi:MAG TPA: hypothetical protein VGD57_03985 [Candidatus Dormibacteraeota bacterium]
MNQEESLRAEIHQTLDAIGGPTPALLPAISVRLRPVSPRRPLVAFGRLAAALAIALVVGTVVFSMHRARISPGPVSTSPTNPISAGPGANIAWVTSQTIHGDTVTGVDGTGRVVGRINAPVELRSPDGTHLYAIVNSGIDIFSAIDGHKERTIPLIAFDTGVPMLSSDGRYLAVSSGSPAMLQLVDLTLGRAIASIDVGVPTFGTPLIVGAQAQHVYIFGQTVVKLAFDGSTLHLEQRVNGSAFPCAGLVAGGVNSAGGLAFRVLADNRTLVAFCPMDGRVTWYDLEGLTVKHEIVVGQQNPFWVTPVFAADGNTLYLHESGTGALHVIDLVHETAGKSTKVAMARWNFLSWLGSLLVTPAYAGGIPRSAAVSPDGNWLYAVGGFGAPGGLSLVHLPDATVRGRWLADQALDSVLASADGRTVYVLTASGKELLVLRADGSQLAKVALPANTYGFIVPTSS